MDLQIVTAKAVTSDICKRTAEELQHLGILHYHGNVGCAKASGKPDIDAAGLAQKQDPGPWD